jgi:hypothetical protein
MHEARIPSAPDAALRKCNSARMRLDSLAAVLLMLAYVIACIHPTKVLSHSQALPYKMAA